MGVDALGMGEASQRTRFFSAAGQSPARIRNSPAATIDTPGRQFWESKVRSQSFQREVGAKANVASSWISVQAFSPTYPPGSKPAR